MMNEGALARTALSQESLKKAWEDFSVSRKASSRADLIQHYSYLVKVTSGRLVATLTGSMERDDLIGGGVIGLIKAVDNFDPTRDVKFETYAIALIRGAILEMLREEDWVPRSVRDKLRALDKSIVALEKELGRAPSEHEIADKMGVTLQQVNELIVRVGRTTMHSLDDVMGGGEDSVKLADMVVDEGTNTESEVHGREMRRILVQGTDKLPERERLVVSLYYHRGLTFREIGKVLGVSEPRAHHLHGQAMTRLRAHMRHQGISQA